jgi:hypothetical protein
VVNRKGFGLLLLLPALAVWAQDTELTAGVDRGTIRENESFRYVLRAEGQLSGRPDLSALTIDFDVLDSFQTASIQIVNGRTEQVTEWVVELIPRGPGAYELPPVMLGDQRSNAVTVEILPADATVDVQGDVFIEVELDREDGYVQAQTVFTLRLFVGIGTGRQTLTAPLIEGGEAIVEKLGSDIEYQTRRGQRDYNVRDRRRSRGRRRRPAGSKARGEPDRRRRQLFACGSRSRGRIDRILQVAGGHRGRPARTIGTGQCRPW